MPSLAPGQGPTAPAPAYLAHSGNARDNRVFKEVKLLAAFTEEEIDLVVVPLGAAGGETFPQVG